MTRPTMTFTGKLTVVTCWCGIAHAIPDDLDKHASGDPAFVVYCPLGHKWVRSVSETTRLRRRLEDAERKATTRLAALDRARAERDHQAARARGYKGAMTRTKNRAAKGICPVPGCKRSFVDVARHVASKHPDYQATPDGHHDHRAD